ncbi:MAG: Plug domain-containing protein, partial [Bacteroidaceae bacterium]|nr:Plug domain-containing protein [Bacteroidaceae bacterium]
MPRTRTVVAVVALLTGCAGESLAKSDIDTLRIMSETEVRAIAVDHRVGVAHPMQTVAVERLENLGIQNVGQALTRMAGTQVRDYGGIGGMKTVSVHSLGASHTGVVYDGVPVSDCQAGQVDLGRFFTDNLGEVALSVGHEDDLLMSASSLASAAMVRI